MLIKVKYFGIIAEKTGVENEDLQLDETMSMLDVINVLVSKHPSLKNADYTISYNHKISTGSEVLEEGGEIALLPPFAGG